jgi:hypothetical protein
MGVFKDFSVCLKNKNININKTDKWKEGDPFFKKLLADSKCLYVSFDYNEPSKKIIHWLLMFW